MTEKRKIKHINEKADLSKLVPGDKVAVMAKGTLRWMIYAGHPRKLDQKSSFVEIDPSSQVGHEDSLHVWESWTKYLGFPGEYILLDVNDEKLRVIPPNSPEYTYIKELVGMLKEQ